MAKDDWVLVVPRLCQSGGDAKSSCIMRKGVTSKLQKQALPGWKIQVEGFRGSGDLS